MSRSSRTARESAKKRIAASAPTRPKPGSRRPAPPIVTPTFGQRLRYRFDATMARGPIALVGWLALITLLLIIVADLVVVIFGLVPDGVRHSLIGQGFNTLLHSIDSGTVAGDTGGWGFLVIELLVTLAGLFVVSALIGVIATALDERLAQLRKGRSFVVESGHTLILGWSDTVFRIISEIAIANESEKDASIVILADEDKVEMEDAIRENVADIKTTRVVCRTGSPISLRDLTIANPQSCRSVIVLSPETDDPDAEVIKTVLALTRGPARRDEPYNIVAEIHDPANLEAARLVGGDQAVFIDKRETIAKLMVLASRQSGASAVYTELLDFDGEEIYFRADASLDGRTYADALLQYEDAAVMGIVRAADGAVLINPLPETVLASGDQVIAVAEDDSVLENASPYAGGFAEDTIVEGSPDDEAPQSALLIGWNVRGATVINELDNYVPAGSTLKVLADTPLAEPAVAAGCQGLENLAVTVEMGNTTDRATLEGLELANFDHIIVLCYADHLEPQKADARTLVTLLHLRDIVAHENDKVSIVSEMLDPGNHELAQVAEVDDVVVSDTVLSLLLAQISENAKLFDVFKILFEAEGSEIYLRPAGDYVLPGAETNFATVVESARRRNETAIGLRLAADADDPSAGYGVQLNPAKSAAWVPDADDRIVVLAED